MTRGKADQVEEVDARAASDDVLGHFHAVELACHHELHPGEPARSREEAIAFYRHRPTTHASCHWLADGGAASLYVHGPRAALLQLLVNLAVGGAASGRSSSPRRSSERASSMSRH